MRLVPSMYGWLFRRRLRREIDEELRFHLEMRTAEYERSGLSARAARHKAQDRFGSVGRVTAACHAVHRLPNPSMQRRTFMESVWQDLRYAVRNLSRQPSFTILTVLTLGLGIGASTIVFSVVHSTLLDPFPFPGGERLVEIWRHRPDGIMSVTPSPESVQAWRRRATSLDAIANYGTQTFLVEVGGEPQRLQAALVSVHLIPMLGLQPRLGRPFVAADTISGRNRVVLLTESYWNQHFGGAHDVVGRTMTLDEEPYTIIGVLPAKADAFFRGSQRSIWVPGSPSPTVARLRAGVTLEDAQAELRGMHVPAAADEKLAFADGWPAELRRLSDDLDSDLRTGLWVLLGAVGFVLLVACVNVANMVLARGVARSHEIGIRTAIGAGRGRIGRQLVVESLLFSSVAAAVGVGLAVAGLQVITAHLPEGLEQLSTARLDWPVLAVTLVVTALPALVFGLIPVGQLKTLHVVEILSQGQRSGAGTPRRNRIRQVLVAAEVALATVLFVGAGLLINSLVRLQQRDPGFNPTNLVQFDMQLPQARYPDETAQETFLDDLLSRIRQLPMVEGAARGRAASWFGFTEGAVVVEGRETVEHPSRPMSVNSVSAEYFATVGMPLRQGRTFTPEDRTAQSRRVIVNEAFARTYWPDEQAAGKRFRFANATNWTTVVGVAGDVRISGLRSNPDGLQLYYPTGTFARLTDVFPLVVRAVGDPEDILPLLKGQVWSLDPKLPLQDLAMVTSVLSRAIARPRFNTFLLGGFAVIALALAAVGVYGVISLTLQQRIHEVGVRLALGAQAKDVFLLMMGYGMRPVVLGAAAGVVLAVGLTRFMRGILFEVQPTDPLTYMAVIAVLGVAGFVACYLPARRAPTVDPVQALRTE